MAPNTARIVEPAHNIRRTFGLGTGSALAMTPSMIDDNELASQTVVDESEVFDDPFYEALVAVGLDDEPAVAEDAPDEAAVETAAAEAPEAQKPESKTEPEFGLEHGSALAMVPSMIDDNLLCSGLVTDEAEVFDDPFFEALVAVEEDDEAPAKEADPESEAEPEQMVADAPSEETLTQPVGQPEDQPKPEPQFGLEHGSALALVPSMIDDNLLCSELVADEAEVFDDPFFEALITFEDEDDKLKAEPEKEDNEAEVEVESGETDGMLYTTASALIEEDEDDEPVRGKHARVAEAPEPEQEIESEPEAEASAEAETELELNMEPKPVALEEASPAAEPEGEPAETSEADSGAADERTAAEEGSNDEKAEQAESPSTANEEAAPPVEDEHAAAQKPAQPVQDEAPAEKLPDDESVADAVDEMVLNSDYGDERTVTSPSSATDADGTPKKQGFWSRFRNLFRRHRG